MAPTPVISDEKLMPSPQAAGIDNTGLFSDEEGEETDEKLKEDDTDVGEKKDEDMADLFGSDYDSEEEFKASGVKESQIPRDERSRSSVGFLPIGNDPIEEDPSVQSSRAVLYNDRMELPTMTRPVATKIPFMVKMPNILRIRSNECNAASLEEEQHEEDLDDAAMYRNTIRWRFKDKTNKERETNTKLVQWDDGSYSLIVGSEVLSVSRQTIGNSFVFQNQTSIVDGKTDTVMECQKPIHEKFTIRPDSTSNKSHRQLTQTVHARRAKGSRALKEYISQVNPDVDKASRAKANEDRMRLESKKRSRDEYHMDQYRSSNRMDADFLEEGFDDDIEYEDEDLSAIKEQYGGKKSRKKKPQRQSREKYSGGYDDYVDEHQDDDSAGSGEEKRTNESSDVDDDDDDELGVVPATSSKTNRRVLLDDDDEDEE